MRAVGVLGIFAAFLLSACVETFDSRYASIEEAVADDAISRGWIPGWLPGSSRNIRETHNIDTNSYMIRFEFPEGERVTVPAECVQTQPKALPQPPFSRRWWPSDVPGKGSEAHRHTYFRCSEKQFVAIGRGEAYIWGQ